MKIFGLMMTTCLAALAAAAPAAAQMYTQGPFIPPPATLAAGISPNVRALPAKLDKRMTARGMIGKPVYNQEEERIATVEDIILDSQGTAKMVVVKENNFVGLAGKLAAFDYDAIVDRRPDGDVILPVTAGDIGNAAEFSYAVTDRPNVKVIPDDGYSTKKILEGNLIDPSGKKLAAIDNVALTGGKATMLIVAYDQILNMGGERAALDFDAAQPVRDKDHINLKLSNLQTQKFEDFREMNK